MTKHKEAQLRAILHTSLPILALVIGLGISAIAQVASADNPCELYTTYTTDRQCDNGDYVGPNRPDLHGGVCLYWNTDMCTIDTYYTRDRNCDRGYHYAGPNRADLHGGYCIREMTGLDLRTHYTINKEDCYWDEVYVGPNRPELHGGYCLHISNCR